MVTGIIIVVSIATGICVGFLASKKIREAKVREAEELSRKLVEEGKREADKYRKVTELELRAEWSKKREEFEREIANRRKETERREREVEEKEKNTERRSDLLFRKEKELDIRHSQLRRKEGQIEEEHKRLDELIRNENVKLEKLSGMTQKEAKETLLSNLEEEAKHEAMQRVKEIRDKAEKDAEREAKKIISLAIQRYAQSHTVESTVTTVALPSDEMKGRLIGREGRNIKTFELATGVDLLIDDTPETVTISSFDPIRRETAKIALRRLIIDGRVHPARIEEIVEESKKEIEELVKKTGEETVLEMNITGLSPEIIKLLGKLKFRTSYGQNVLEHSKEVAYFSDIMAQELNLDHNTAKRAGLLHDIGKALSQDVQGTHQKIGADIARRCGESEEVVNAIEAHHGDVEPLTPIAVLVEAADAISGARPGARRESFEAYVERLEKLENIAISFEGVGKAYAIQAGREIRVIVEPEKVSDVEIDEMTDEIAKKIEQELKYPGQIKVVAVRETRSVKYAK
jgi:ribonuclease Y